MLTAVFAANDKQIEKCVKQIPDVNILCSVKRREAIVDTVIEYNPHMVIIKKSLPGKTDFREIIRKLRTFKPDLKIVFLYGRPDEEYRSFLDYLISQRVYDFVLGDIDEVELNAAIRGDKKLKDVEQFILTNEDKERAKEQEAKSLIEKEERPASEREKVTQSPEVFIVEKIVEKTKIEQRYIGTIKIAIAGLYERTGCTHLSMEMCGYLNEKYRKDVGVVISDDVLQSIRDYYTITTPETKIKGIKLYRNDTEAISKHKAVIYDLGRLTDDNLEAFQNANVQVIICPSAPWEVDTITDFLRLDDVNVQNIEYVFFPITDQYYKEIRRNMEKGGCRTYQGHFNPSPFVRSANDRNYEKMLQKLIKDM